MQREGSWILVRHVSVRRVIAADNDAILEEQLDVLAIGGLEARRAAADTKRKGVAAAHRTVGAEIGGIVEELIARDLGVADGGLETAAIDVGVIALVLHRGKQIRMVLGDVVGMRRLHARRFVVDQSSVVLELEPGDLGTVVLELDLRGDVDRLGCGIAVAVLDGQHDLDALIVAEVEADGFVMARRIRMLEREVLDQRNIAIGRIDGNRESRLAIEVTADDAADDDAVFDIELDRLAFGDLQAGIEALAALEMEGEVDAAILGGPVGAEIDHEVDQAGFLGEPDGPGAGDVRIVTLVGDAVEHRQRVVGVVGVGIATGGFVMDDGDVAAERQLGNLGTVILELDDGVRLAADHDDRMAIGGGVVVAVGHLDRQLDAEAGIVVGEQQADGLVVARAANRVVHRQILLDDELRRIAGQADAQGDKIVVMISGILADLADDGAIGLLEQVDGAAFDGGIEAVDLGDDQIGLDAGRRRSGLVATIVAQHEVVGLVDRLDAIGAAIDVDVEQAGDGLATIGAGNDADGLRRIGGQQQ